MVQRYENHKMTFETTEIHHCAARALEHTLLRYATNPCTSMYIRSISNTAYTAVAYFYVAAELLEEKKLNKK